MTENPAQPQQFTGLILLTGTDAPGIATSLFETLAPFAVHVIDIEQVVINARLILTVLIGANPAHQKAIEDDLGACATALDVDIATIFAKTDIQMVPQRLLKVVVASVKLHPQALALVTDSITNSGANIESFSRISDDPTTIAITTSGVSKEDLDFALSSVIFEDVTTVSLSVS
jgi:phosphoserine phosphatase